MVASVVRRAPKSRQQFELSYTLSVITPVFGGGVVVHGDDRTRHLKEIDRVTPVRGAGVRGQLRFWWRAVRGVAEPSASEMRAREQKIWGAASLPGGVSLRVTGRPEVKEKRVFSVEQREPGKWRLSVAGTARDRKSPLEPWAYAAFALQPAGELLKGSREPSVGTLWELEGNFKLTLSGPLDYEDEVRAAVDAWLAFGGVGGRTRRGFGALRRIRGVNDPAERAEDLLARLVKGRRAQIRGVPTLVGSTLRSNRLARFTANGAHLAALDALKTFRQGAGVGRNLPAKDSLSPGGRSRWPEADLLRQIAHTPSTARHGKRQVFVDKLPRAEFGLPIIFHFQPGAGDPGDSTLLPEGLKRFASPLILRPYDETPSGREDSYAAVALALAGTRDTIEHLELDFGQTRVTDERNVPRTFSGKLTPEESKLLQPVGGSASALDAFLDYFRSFRRLE